MLTRRFACLLCFTATIGCTKSDPMADLEDAVKAIPWMLQVFQDCEQYDATKSETEHRDIATRVQRLARASKVDNVKGEVETVFAEGDGYKLQVKVANKVRFATQKDNITKGSALYDQAKRLRERQCVTFSASNFKPISNSQRGKVCDPRYYAEFSAIQPCQ